MSSNSKIDLFNGDNSEECAAFIRAIRAAAWGEGKLRDPVWMADFASLYLSSRALFWHAKLPLEVRQDWFKLEAALVDRWAPADEDDDLHIQPVPAAAPKPADGDGSDSVMHGFLKAVPNDGQVTPLYVTFDSELEACAPTQDRETALRVCLHSRFKPGLLEWTGGSMCSWLAIHSSRPAPLIGRGSAGWALLTIVSSVNLRSSWVGEGPWQLMGCTVSANGEITPVWRDVNNSKEIPLYVFIGEEGVYFVTNPETYSQANPDEMRAKLVIEPID